MEKSTGSVSTENGTRIVVILECIAARRKAIPTNGGGGADGYRDRAPPAMLPRSPW